jgi:LuxR family maltose regulon positive regulatory protein
MAYSLTLITAPAGSALTSLLTRWATGAACPAAYLRLAPDHDALYAFVNALTVSVAALFPPLLPDTVAHPPDDLTALLVNALAAPHSDYALVVDRYDQIHDPAIHHAMASLLDYPPPCLHLYLVAPATVPLPTARLRARRQLLELDAARLVDVSLSSSRSTAGRCDSRPPRRPRTRR